MKSIEIQILKKILSILEDHSSQQVLLLKEFREILDSISADKINSYRRNPVYYKARVREWEKLNPEKRKEYSKRYNEKKKAERIAKILELQSQGYLVPEIAVLLKISEKTVLNCLQQHEQARSDEAGKKEDA